MVLLSWFIFLLCVTFWFLTNAWNSICRPGPCQPPVPPVQRPLGSLPHSCKNTLLVQVREILWATKQQVEVSTPATISSAIPPALKTDQPPYQRRPHVEWYWWRLRRPVTRKRRLAQWHLLSYHLPRSLSSPLQQSEPPLSWSRPAQASALLHLSLCLGYILSRDIFHRLNYWLSKVIPPA